MAIGGDDIKALRQQISELKLEDKAAWINNQQDWPDIWGVPETLFGVFGTTWYHMLKLPGVAEFVKRWQTTYPQSPIPVPGNVSYNGYMATRELLRAIEQTGSTNNIAIIKALEGRKMSAVDRMQNYDAWIDPVIRRHRWISNCCARSASAIFSSGEDGSVHSTTSVGSSLTPMFEPIWGRSRREVTAVTAARQNSRG